MRNDTIENRLKRVRDNINSLKSTQKVASDSWKLYRYSTTFTKEYNEDKFAVFRVKYPDIPAVVRLNQELWTYSLYPMGIRSQNGVYLFVLPHNAVSDYKIGLTSTQEGTLTIEDSPPF